MLLLSKATNNTKLEKTEKVQTGYSIVSLTCGNMPTKKMCPFSTPACRTSCLTRHGHFVYPRNKQLLAYKAKQYLLMQNEFMSILVADIEEHQEKAAKMDKLPCVRLGTTHDAIGCGMYEWEKRGKRLYDLFPNVLFYEYTKAPLVWRQKHNIGTKNVHIVFSRTESNAAACIEELKNLGKVAVIFEDVPQEWQLGEKTFNVVDGDVHDLHFLHPAGCIIGLRAKGPYIVRDTSGLLVRRNK